MNMDCFYPKAWITRANALMKCPGITGVEQARKELSYLIQEGQWGHNDTVLRGVYERADFEVRRARRPDYYELLGLISSTDTNNTPSSSSSSSDQQGSKSDSEKHHRKKNESLEKCEGDAKNDVSDDVETRRRRKAAAIASNAINRRKTATTAEIKTAYKNKV